MKKYECVKYKDLLFRFGVNDSKDKIVTNTLFWFDNIYDINNIYYYPLYKDGNNEFIGRYINLLSSLNKIYYKNEVDKYFVECYKHGIDFLYYDMNDIDIDESAYKDYRLFCNYKLAVYGNIMRNNNIDVLDPRFNKIIKFDNNKPGFANLKNTIKGVDNALKLDINSPEIRLYLYNVYNLIINDDLYNYYMKYFGVNCDRSKFKNEFIVYFYSAHNYSMAAYMFFRNVGIGNTQNFNKFNSDLIIFKDEIAKKYNGSYINDFYGRKINIKVSKYKDYDMLVKKIFAVYLQSSVTNYNFKVAFDLLNSGFNIWHISREEIIVNGNDKLNNIDAFFDGYMLYTVNKYHN